ncbi:MAG: DUF362 domain-containing protein [Lachnospiraceae bacterium]|nr:DUF362 domain-containing protein [Candidatus Equihabitans merdae]
MRKGIAMLGGLESMMAPDQKILVKPNFLLAADPDKATTTHPSVIKGMLRILQEDGYAKVSFGDSPGHGSCEGVVNKIGIKDESNWFGAKRANMEEEVTVSYPEGKTCRTFHFSKGIAEADAIINLCKMKTHALERITGAVKNVYGFICGYRKAAGHVKYPDATVFARMLADMHNATNIPLHIMDGVVAMEGNGPSSGTPIAMNVLLFSKDPVAIDTVFSHMIYLDPQVVPTCVEGQAYGVGTCDINNIEVLMAPAEDAAEQVLTPDQLREQFGKPNFDVERKVKKKNALSLITMVIPTASKRPYVQKDLCIKCGICVDHCPVEGKAINFKKGKGKPPVYDYKKCIRCYCCLEMCPRHAIKVKGGLH